MKFVFDFAGVLFQWQPAAMLRREIPHHARDAASAQHWVQEIFQAFAGDWGDFDRGAVEVPTLVGRIARRTGLPAADVQRVVGAVPHELQPVPATVALLRRLRDTGCVLYYLSNMPAPYADHLQARHDFVAWFRDGVFSARVGANKPEAAIYELAAARFDAEPAELVFMDDHLPNVQAARALGWNALLFSDAAQAEAELRDRGWA